MDATGIINTFAGGWSGDGGQATAASIAGPRGVALDSYGNIYITEAFNNRIRKITASGTITTVVGNGTGEYSGDGGPATSAGLNSPYGITLDSSGNLYIADASNNRIRKVDPAGVITTVAGNGTAGFSGDNGPATSASLKTPQGVAVDASGNLYIADSSNYRIRKVDTSGIITTFAGNGNYLFSGDGGPAISAGLFAPRGVAVDPSGNIIIADTGHYRIRKVDTSGIISTVAGNGTAAYSGDGGPAVSASFISPWGVAVASGNIYVADSSNDRIRMVDSSGMITTIAGNGVAGYTGDGVLATSSNLNSPYAVALSASGSIYIADMSNHRVRMAGNIQTVSLREVVVDSSGNRIPGAYVMVVGNPSLSAYSDASGVFVLPVPQGVPFSHSISKAGYRTLYTSTRTLTASSLTYRQRILYADSEVAAWGVNTGFSAIRGRVMDSETSQTIYNAAVTAASTVNPGLMYAVIYDALCSTGTGTCYYTVVNVAPNYPVILTVSAPGYITTQVQYNPLPADSVGSAITRLTQNVSSASYISTLTGTWTDFYTAQTETVNISVHSGTSLYTASGAVSGQLTMSTSRYVQILSGTYSGWSYRVSTYDLAGYHGNHYMVSDAGPQRSWGVFTGDLNGVYINTNGERKVYLTSIRGVRTSGVIDLAHDSTSNGTPAYYNDTTMLIRHNSKSAMSTGYYNGTIRARIPL